MRERLIVVGNGMVGLRLVEELLARAPDRYDLTVVGKEPRPAYNRVLLSSLLAGQVSGEDVRLRDLAWYAENGVRLILGAQAEQLDPGTGTVRLADGSDLAFDRLVLATGSQPIRPPMPGLDLSGVLTFRDLADVDAIHAACARGRRAVVIGGGLLGIEAAYGLARAGLAVNLVHLMDRLMERQLDPRAGQLLQTAVESKGIRVRPGGRDRGVRGPRHGRGGATEGRPRSAGGSRWWSRSASARRRHWRGRPASPATAASWSTTVSKRLPPESIRSANAPSIAASATAWSSPAMRRHASSPRLRPAASDTYTGSVLATNLKVSGVGVFSTGEFLGREGTEEIILSDPGLPAYKKLVSAGLPKGSGWSAPCCSARRSMASGTRS